MALDFNNLYALAKATANCKKGAPVNYSFNGETLDYDAMNEALRAEFSALAGTNALYRENKNKVFSLIEQVVTDVLPAKVNDYYGTFATVKTFKQGEQVVFRRKLQGAKLRAKQFITRVGLAGVYEVFKLGGTESFEIKTSAIGGACEISLEEFLDGRADFAEMIEIIIEGMNDLIYKEVAKAMQAAIAQLPAANKYSAAGFDEALFDKALVVASAYGTPTIYASLDFAVKMIPSDAWRYSDNMKDQLWNNGHFTTYKTYRVVILPNGFTDGTNSERVINPGFVWIMPGDVKPAVIAIEGSTQSRELEQADWSRKFEVYQKVGVAVLMTNNIVSYEDTALSADPYTFANALKTKPTDAVTG